MAGVPFPHVHEPNGPEEATLASALAVTGADGAAHIFVDPAEGNDANDGRSADNPATVSGGAVQSTGPLRTIQRAIDRLNAWLTLGLEQDFVVDLAAGSYGENVKAFLATIPKGRVFFRGPSAGTVVQAARLAVAGTGANIVVVGGAAMAVNAHAGLVMHVVNPATGAEQWRTIRSNTATGLEPDADLSPLPAIGWTVEVIRPTAIIATDPTDQEAAGFSLVCPWSDVANGAISAPNGPSVHLDWIQFGKIGLGGYGYPAVEIKGGTAVFVGCVVQVDAPNAALDGVDFLKANALAGFVPFAADPVYGLAAFSLALMGCGLGVRGAGILGNGLRWDAGSWWNGPVNVADGAGAPFAINGAIVNIMGGGMIGAVAFEVDELAYVAFSVGGTGAGLPFLFFGSASAALDARRRSLVEINSGAVAFRSLVGGAIEASRGAYVMLLGPPAAQANPADIPGFGVDIATGATVQAAGAVTAANFAATGFDVQSDAGTNAAWVGAAALVLQAGQSLAYCYQI